jgi:hypothetical protein
MDAAYDERRRQIEARFRWFHRVRADRESEVSPSGNFKLTIDTYGTGENTWAYSRGRVFKVGSRRSFADVKRNYSHFWRAWIQHANGHEYLLCGEDYQGQTVINLTARETRHHFPTSGYAGHGFCWTAAYPSPDSAVLAVDGCYWACPYEVVFFDFRDPDNLPYKELARVDDLAECRGWRNDGYFELVREVEVRKSDGRPYRELSEPEQNDLDNQPGSTEYVQRLVAVAPYASKSGV